MWTNIHNTRKAILIINMAGKNKPKLVSKGCISGLNLSAYPIIIITTMVTIFAPISICVIIFNNVVILLIIIYADCYQIVVAFLQQSNYRTHFFLFYLKYGQPPLAPFAFAYYSPSRFVACPTNYW